MSLTTNYPIMAAGISTPCLVQVINGNVTAESEVPTVMLQFYSEYFARHIPLYKTREADGLETTPDGFYAVLKLHDFAPLSFDLFLRWCPHWVEDEHGYAFTNKFQEYATENYIISSDQIFGNKTHNIVLEDIVDAYIMGDYLFARHFQNGLIYLFMTYLDDAFNGHGRYDRNEERDRTFYDSRGIAQSMWDWYPDIIKRIYDNTLVQDPLRRYVVDVAKRLMPATLRVLNSADYPVEFLAELAASPFSALSSPWWDRCTSPRRLLRAIDLWVPSKTTDSLAAKGENKYTFKVKEVREVFGDH